MSTIHYFDIFKHPLRESELMELVHYRQVTCDELSEALSFLLSHSLLHEYNGYYLPHTEFENVLRRANGLDLSEKYWLKAQKQSVLISNFPFVRSVLISGSLSKGYMDAQSDIDYLIITKPGRLWMARTFLILYKKIFLLNSHKFFCVNYFLDLNHLVLSDRNIFTATELVFAKPVYNHEVYAEFLKANSWTKEYYPALKIDGEPKNRNLPAASGIKTFLEGLLNTKGGDFIENFCMKISDYFWTKKFRNMSRHQFQQDMKSEKGVSKHHPNGFRDKIVQEHAKRMAAFLNHPDFHAGIEEPTEQPVFVV